MKSASLGILILAQYISHAWSSIATGKSRWSPSFLSQASDLSCEPGEIRNNVTFLHGTKSGNFTKLGKVSDLEVCMLLCCELDRCQAAFLAGKNCYSVTCFTTNHCATAPALNNKWQPVVAFVKRLYKAVHVQAASKGAQITNDAVDHGKTTNQGSGSGATDNSTSGNASAKKKAHLKKFFKEEDDKKNKNTHDDARLTIPAEGRADTVELEELQKQASSKGKVAHAQKHSAKYNLVSAAVATCLMAFVLSGCAVVAARIRKRKENITDYAQLSEGQE
ncbi:uncharacterized protein LOC110066219 [Orbicella faveolata]|uniref:uncharacterized protein LOC110066219 n=1 Tax=Orbicella faveolata TaxID=48498 RepID=UPI0009E1921C|nr:uncharacterized protein LOC110066219 [Orbicella faveolata]